LGRDAVLLSVVVVIVGARASGKLEFEDVAMVGGAEVPL
jgi:hypothetical protein